MARRFVSPESAGWFRGLMKVHERKVKTDEKDMGSIADGVEDKRERFAKGKIDHEVRPFTRRILEKYDFGCGDERTCKIATIKLRRVLMAYFGVEDYRRYVAVASVHPTDDGNVTAEVGYDKGIGKSDNVGSWSLVNARREFNAKD